MEPLLLGIDKGTTMNKAVLFDRSGRTVAVASAPSPGRWPHPGWHEEDPSESWEQVRGLVHQVLADPAAAGRRVAAIGVTAHMGGLILLDDAGAPVRPNILWDDGRAAAIVDEWYASGMGDELFAVGGNAVLAGLTVPLLAWLKRHEPDRLTRARWLMTTKDYFVYRLTGVVGTDETDGGWMPGDVHKRTHSDRIRQMCGVDDLARLFPPVRRSDEVVGTVTDGVADELGLPPGVPVVAGLGDANSATVGAGVIAPGQAVSVIGTSLLNNLVLNGPDLAPAGIGFLLPTVSGRWLRLLPNTGGGATNIKWLVENLYSAERASVGAGVYSLVDREVTSLEPGAGGVLYHPYINGAGVVAPFYHLGARGQFFGLSSSAGRPHLARAVFEGIALSIRDCYAAAGLPVAELRLVGGAARSPVLCQITADVMGAPVRVPKGEEASALGAALVAGVGAGVYQSLDEAVKAAVTLDRSYEPARDRTRRYAEIYPLFRLVRESLTAAWTMRQQLFGG